jgi:putative ABC transport system permease protein
VLIIALHMLFGDRGKYLGMIIGVTFAALIMTQQPSIFVGLMSRTFAFIDDVSLPDIWVMDPGVEYVEESKPMRDTALTRVRGVTGVAWAVPMFKATINVRLPDGQTKSISLAGLDDATLVGGPPEMAEGSLASLRQTDGVIVDQEAARDRLAFVGADGRPRPLAVGDEVEINDNRAVVVGIGRSSRDFVLMPKAFTTYSRALAWAPPQRRQLTYVLVKARDGVDPAELARRIAADTGLKAQTQAEFRRATLSYWMENTGIPINFGISVALGFLVGAAIAGQSFFNFVRENLDQYAALKAMGLRTGVVVRMVLLQAGVVGLVGYGLGVGIAAIFGTNVKDSVLAFALVPEILLFAAAGVLLIVSLSALLGIRQVIRLDPAVVFRS